MPTRRLWMDCIIKSTFMAPMLIRAEQEGGWLLHQHCLQKMLPYFYAGGHYYACHISWYLEEMNCLPVDAKADLMAGAFVCGHKEGVCNAVSADQFGEQDYIHYGKSKWRFCWHNPFSWAYCMLGALFPLVSPCGLWFCVNVQPWRSWKWPRYSS